MACYNPPLTEEGGRKRRELPQATEQRLTKIGKEVTRRKKKPLKEAESALKVGKVLGHYEMDKHFEYTISDGSFQGKRGKIPFNRRRSWMGSTCVAPTSRRSLSPKATVRSYKSLSIERSPRNRPGKGRPPLNPGWTKGSIP